MDPQVDPESPVPLYHQIAEAIRARILAGDLRPGDALVPLREAARRWSVNLHTVRHAYTALAREGLVESHGPRGTLVADGAAGEGVEVFLSRVVTEARERHGLSPAELSRKLDALEVRTTAPRPVVHVVECSLGQAREHARELESVWDVEALPWSLDEHDRAPDGAIVATYFHYNDLRRMWPRRMRDVEFVTIAPAASIAQRLDALRGSRASLRVAVVELDLPTAENIAADLSAVLRDEPYELSPVALPRPEQAVEQLADDEVAVFAPRSWATLSAEARAHPRVVQAHYAIDRGDLDELGSRFAWRRAREGRGPRGGSKKELSR